MQHFYIVGSHVEGNESIIKQIVLKDTKTTVIVILIQQRNQQTKCSKRFITPDLTSQSFRFKTKSLRPPYGFDKMVKGASRHCYSELVDWHARLEI